MAPWRIIRLATVGQANWVSTSDLVYTNQLRTNSELIKAGAGWLVKGGANVACQIQPSECGKHEDSKKIVTGILISHPFEWTAYKFSRAPRYLMAPIVCDSGLTSLGKICRKFANNKLPQFSQRGISWPRPFFLTVFFSTYFYHALNLIRGSSSESANTSVVLFWFNTALVMATLCVMLIVHFETRYFFSPFIFSVVSGMAGLMALPRNLVRR